MSASPHAPATPQRSNRFPPPRRAVEPSGSAMLAAGVAKQEVMTPAEHRVPVCRRAELRDRELRAPRRRRAASGRRRDGSRRCPLPPWWSSRGSARARAAASMLTSRPRAPCPARLARRPPALDGAALPDCAASRSSTIAGPARRARPTWTCRRGRTDARRTAHRRHRHLHAQPHPHAADAQQVGVEARRMRRVGAPGAVSETAPGRAAPARPRRQARPVEAPARRHPRRHSFRPVPRGRADRRLPARAAPARTTWTGASDPPGRRGQDAGRPRIAEILDVAWPRRCRPPGARYGSRRNGPAATRPWPDRDGRDRSAATASAITAPPS